MSKSGKALILIASSGSEKIILILVAACLSRLLSKADYATYRQTVLTYEISAPLLILGLPAALFYFSSSDPSGGGLIVKKILKILFFTGLLFLLFFVFGGNYLVAELFNNQDLVYTLRYYALFPVLVLPFAILTPLLVTKEQPTLVPKLVIPLRLAQFLLVVLPLLLFSPNPRYSVVGQVVFAFLCCGTVLLVVRRVCDRDEFIETGIVSAKKILVYAIPLCLASVIEGLAMKTDRVLVASLCSKEDFSVFVNGSMEIPFISVITGSVTAILLPEIIKLYRERSYQQAMNLWKRAAEKVAIILLPIGGMLFLIAPELMVVLYSEGFKESSTPFRFYMLLMPARVVAFGVIFQAAKRSDLILKRAVGTLTLNMLVSYPLIKKFGSSGAAIGTILVFWLYVIPYCLFYASRLSKTKLKHLLPFKKISLIIAVIVFAILVSTEVTTHFTLNVYASGFIKVGSYGVLVCLGLLFFLREDFLKMLNGALNRVRG